MNQDKPTISPKGKKIFKTGVVMEALPNTSFKVKSDDGGETLMVHLSGKMRLFKIKILVGDKVRMEMSPYDLTKGRIVYRGKYV